MSIYVCVLLLLLLGSGDPVALLVPVLCVKQCANRTLRVGCWSEAGARVSQARPPRPGGDNNSWSHVHILSCAHGAAHALVPRMHN